MSNQTLAAQLRAYAGMFDEAADVKNENINLKLRLVLLFFGARYFSTPDMLICARNALSKGYVYIDMILGADGGIFVGRTDEVKQATSLAQFEALCLELAATQNSSPHETPQ